MTTNTSAHWDLARRLIAIEASRDSLIATNHGICAVRALSCLRIALVRLSGSEGVRSLMSRALALAKSSDPSLNAVKILEDGSLEGIETNAQGATHVLVQFLALLVIFIGKSLSMRLIRDAWPNENFDDTDGLDGAAI